MQSTAKHSLKDTVVFEVIQLSKLAIPVLIAQVTITAMAFVDTVMASAISPTDMAAVAVAASFWNPVILLIQGLLLALTPIVAQLSGARRHKDIPSYIWQGAWLAIITVIFAGIALYFSLELMNFMDVEPELKRLTSGYILAVLPALPAFALFQVLKNFVEGMSHTLPTMLIGFIGLLINIPANAIFINGLYGMPALGAIGCGVATTLVYWGMLIAMFIYLKSGKRYQSFKLYHQFQWPDKEKLKNIISIGSPIALAFFFEVSLFAIVALLLTPMGSIVVAGHQIAINYTTLIFMLPLSIAMAVTIRSGFLLGKNNPHQAMISSISGIGIGLALSFGTAIISYSFRNEIASFYSSDPEVIKIAVPLLLLAAAYQLSDAVQVISAGALRGFKDTISIFYITLFSFWGLGLPCGILLSTTDYIVPKLGAQGYWIGFIIGLSTAAVLLAFRLKLILKRSIA